MAGYEKNSSKNCGNKLNMKAQGMQMKAQKQQSTAHNNKNVAWTIAR